MPLDEKKILEILLAEDYLRPEDLETAKSIAAAQNESIVDVLFAQNLITREILGEALAEHFGVPFADLEKETFDDAIFFTIPELVAKHHKVVALSRTPAGIKVGMPDPTNQAVIDLIQKRFDEPIVPCFSFEEDIARAAQRYKADIQKSFDAVLTELKTGDLAARDEITTKTVDLLLQYGYENRASDVHIEPYRDKTLVRFRIDGVLHDVLNTDKDIIEPVVSRIKILAKLRTDEHRAAQDGKLRFIAETGEPVDVRVSVVPTNLGENVVMRLLSEKTRGFQLSSLGLLGKDLDKVRSAIEHPHGMILVTGPTGSGKTTTLYAMLKILNKREVNIATIEDPVEYGIEGVTQIQVNPRTNLTFAQGLRSILRQDPNIIMVGEIRDEETADIAVNSSLTGHLVLSTLHTNDAATALPRLLDMHIEPFLVASTVNTILAQRLVRKICTTCRVSYQMNEEEKQMIAANPEFAAFFKKTDSEPVSLYKGEGCKVCGNTGFVGRIGIFEVLEMTTGIRQLIIRNASAAEIKAKAREEGMTTMMEDGMLKVMNGQTTMEEILRVAKD